jgi:hypothetical protein
MVFSLMEVLEPYACGYQESTVSYIIVTYGYNIEQQIFDAYSFCFIKLHVYCLIIAHFFFPTFNSW